MKFTVRIIERLIPHCVRANKNDFNELIIFQNEISSRTATILIEQNGIAWVVPALRSRVIAI